MELKFNLATLLRDHGIIIEGMRHGLFNRQGGEKINLREFEFSNENIKPFALYRDWLFENVNATNHAFFRTLSDILQIIENEDNDDEYSGRDIARFAGYGWQMLRFLEHSNKGWNKDKPPVVPPIQQIRGGEFERAYLPLSPWWVFHSFEVSAGFDFSSRDMRFGPWWTMKNTGNGKFTVHVYLPHNKPCTAFWGLKLDKHYTERRDFLTFDQHHPVPTVGERFEWTSMPFNYIHPVTGEIIQIDPADLPMGLPIMDYIHELTA